jgi:hypothetical protein
VSPFVRRPRHRDDLWCWRVNGRRNNALEGDDLTAKFNNCLLVGRQWRLHMASRLNIWNGARCALYLYFSATVRGRTFEGRGIAFDTSVSFLAFCSPTGAEEFTQ